MLYIAMKGGLGNQMFQYAFWYEIKKTRPAELDDTWFRERKKSVQLADIVPSLSFTSADLSSIADIRASFVSRVKKHLFKKKTHIIEDNSVLFDVASLSADCDWYLDGYWQAFDYFKNSVDELRELFFPYALYSKARSELHSRFSSSQRFCSVHVRRGDYVKDSVMACQEPEWYNRQIASYINSYPHSLIIIFSDDIPFCKKYIHDSGNMVFCDWNNTALADLYNMAVCDDHILSNSTFSYWGALLSRQEGLTVYPENWFSAGGDARKRPFMFPKDWICRG